MRLRVIMPPDKKNKDKKSKSVSVNNMDTIPSLFDQTALGSINTFMEPMTPR